jgi:hypothetical protein
MSQITIAQLAPARFPLDQFIAIQLVAYKCACCYC